jgi:hypothetical protein
VGLGYDAVLLMRIDGGKGVVLMMKNVSIFEWCYTEISIGLRELFEYKHPVTGGTVASCDGEKLRSHADQADSSRIYPSGRPNRRQGPGMVVQGFQNVGCVG